MKSKDRMGNVIDADNTQDKLLEKLYRTRSGKLLLKILIMPWVSNAVGMFMDSIFSKGMIAPFVKKNKICLDDYVEESYDSYNDFFTRRIRMGRRPFDMAPGHVTAPCDSKLTVYPVNEDSVFWIKGCEYTLQSLTHSKKIARYYQGGYMMVFRLTVDDYHHYAYIDSGTKTKNYRIPGVYHTVNPVACEEYPIYKENTREFSLLKSDHFGTVLMLEVGALLVGKIVNHHEACRVRRGMEKGLFEFGGSTVILLFAKDQIEPDPDILENGKAGFETKVKMGEKIGKAKRI